MTKKIINYRCVSRILTGSDHVIRSNYVPKKYQNQVSKLEDKIESWVKLNEAIKKAKPNMDKIKDVDKHLDSIR